MQDKVIERGIGTHNVFCSPNKQAFYHEASQYNQGTSENLSEQRPAINPFTPMQVKPALFSAGACVDMGNTDSSNSYTNTDLYPSESFKERRRDSKMYLPRRILDFDICQSKNTTASKSCLSKDSILN